MSSVSAARRFVRDALDGVPRSVSSDLELVTSELVTNAFEHGSPAPVLVTVSVGDTRASVTIESRAGGGVAVGDVEEWTIAAADQPTGRGLGIVRAIADDVDVHHDGTSLTITAHRNL